MSRPVARPVPAGRFSRQLRGGAGRARTWRTFCSWARPAATSRCAASCWRRRAASSLPRPGDDLLITNGCQQALDLIGRVLLRPGDTVAVEDPVYPGLKNLLAGMGAQLAGHPGRPRRHGPGGIWNACCERERVAPRLLVVTSNFQNPTGATLPLAARRALLEMARAAGVPVVENDAYGELRYSRRAAAGAQAAGRTRRDGAAAQFFEGQLSRPARGLGARAEAAASTACARPRKPADLHTDQLSQAVLLDFAESGRLEAHRARVLQAGAERLAATLEACRRYLRRKRA